MSSKKTTDFDIFGSNDKKKTPSDKIQFEQEKIEAKEEKTEAQKQKEKEAKKKKAEAQKKRTEEKKQQEGKERTEQEQMLSDIEILKGKNDKLSNTVKSLKKQISSFKVLTDELTHEAERDLEASKLVGKFADLKKTIKALNSKNKQLSALYDIKIEAYKTDVKLFQLDLDLIRKAVIHHFPEIKNWKDLSKEDRLRLSPETYSIQASVNRIWSGRISYLEDYVQIINAFPNECISEAYIPEKLDSKTLEVIKEYLIELIEL